MRPWAAGILVGLTIIVSSGIGYFWREQEIDKLRDELGDVKSSLGMEVRTLRDKVEKQSAELAEAERRLDAEQADRKILEEQLAKSGVWK